MLSTYLKATKCVVRTDHKVLKWILNMEYAAGKKERWLLRISEMEFEFFHRAGIVNQVGD